MPITLLIVDDSDLIRSSLRKLLGSVAGIATIREAVTLYEAIESVHLDPPNLVILDLNLPDGSGMHIIEQLRQASPTLWIAVFTFHADPGYRRHCLALGADWFFDKADNSDGLLAAVRQLTETHPQIHSNQGTLHE